MGRFRTRVIEGSTAGVSEWVAPQLVLLDDEIVRQWLVAVDEASRHCFDGWAPTAVVERVYQEKFGALPTSRLATVLLLRRLRDDHQVLAIEDRFELPEGLWALSGEGDELLDCIALERRKMHAPTSDLALGQALSAPRQTA